MAHSHQVAVTPRTRRLLTGAAIVLAGLTALGAWLVRPGSGADRPDLTRLGAASSFVDARVIGREPGACTNAGVEGQANCELLRLRILTGPESGSEVEIDYFRSSAAPQLDTGDKAVLSYSSAAEPGFEYQVADRDRKPVLLWLAVLFAAAVATLGRLRGLAALVGLGATLVILVQFGLPAIIDGRNPLAVSVVTAAAISFFALYLAHGFTPMTTVALLGTLASLALTAALAVAFVELAQFSGFATEEATFLEAAGLSVDLRGLLLAGVIIGALGALDDMTVTQASAVWELRSANPDLPPGRLLAAGLRIGRDHVASTVNTLFLAYVGASMPLMLLFVLAEQPLVGVLNSEVVATEIVRTLVGSVGLVASVPITTWLAARIAQPGQRTTGRPRRPRQREDWLEADGE